jgi:RNA polymerase sigma factor (sigma-70 family)
MSFNFSLYEDELVNNCLKGERLAQKEVYDRYKDAMYNIALRITNNPDDACDCLQEAFIQIYRDLGKFNKMSTLGAWIKTIVVRTAIKTKKALYLTESIDEVRSDEIIEWPNELSGEDLNRAISELSDGYRMVFLLTEVEGYTHKEVAEMLNISAGTSKSQLFHAKKLLQKKLKHLT